MDIHCIKYIDQEIMANNVRDWQGLEELIVKRIDEIFHKMKRVMTAMTLKQGDWEDLLSFMSCLKIAQDSVEWETWPDERKKAADLFQRITDEKLKDELMKKANNNVENFTVQFIIDIYWKMEADAREELKQVESYAKID